MGKCVVKECNSRSQKLNRSKGITFHTVPKDAARREKWVEIIRLLRKETDWLPTKFTIICSKHFRNEDKLERKSDFGRVYLSNDAIPILNTSQSHKDAEPSTTQVQPNNRTELIHIKIEPETCDDDPPNVQDTDQCIKTEISIEPIVKTEPIECNEETTNVHEHTIKEELSDNSKDEATTEDTPHSESSKPLFLLNSSEGTMLLQQSNYSFCLLPVPSKTVEVSVEQPETLEDEDTQAVNVTSDPVDTANTYQCDLCQKIFNLKTSLKRHISLCHDKITIDCKDKLFKCNICDKSYNYASLLKAHLASHSSARPYNCDICSKAFSLPMALTRHIRTHSVEKPFKCKTCDKAYTNASGLFYHTHYTLSHAEERPFKCNSCDKAFNNANGLKLHKLTHIEDKPFKCEECDKTFKRARYLKTHIRTHTDDRPYKCSQCDKAFKHSGTLASHIITHTGDKPYKCNICEKSFNQSSNLKTHIRIHSGEKVNKNDLLEPGPA